MSGVESGSVPQRRPAHRELSSGAAAVVPFLRSRGVTATVEHLWSSLLQALALTWRASQDR